MPGPQDFVVGNAPKGVTGFLHLQKDLGLADRILAAIYRIYPQLSRRVLGTDGTHHVGESERRSARVPTPCRGMRGTG